MISGALRPGVFRELEGLLVADLELRARAVVEGLAGATAEEARRSTSALSHARGTPTPSAPGTPPAMISGALSGGIYSTPAVSIGVGFAARAVAATYYSVYQEMGTRHIPPRPFLLPAFNTTMGGGAGEAITAAAVARFGQGGGLAELLALIARFKHIQSEVHKIMNDPLEYGHHRLKHHARHAFKHR